MPVDVTPNAQLDLRNKIPTTAELKTELARARTFTTQRADPQGGTIIRTGSSTRKYFALSQNPTVKAAIETLTSAVFWPNWGIKSQCDLDRYPEYKELDELIINFLERNLHELEFESFDNILRAIADASLIYGWSVNEQVWDSKDGFWFLTAIKPKPSFDFDANTDPFDNIQSLYHLNTGLNYNPNVFIITTYPYYRDGNPYGVSELESIEKDILALEELEKIFTIGTANTLNRTIIHYFDMTGLSEEEMIDRNTAIETGLTADGAVINLPATTNTETDELIKRNIFETLDDRASDKALPAVENRILELQKRINRNFGIQDDLGQATVNVGSLAKSQVEFSIFAAKRNTLADFVRSFVNKQIINRIINYNWDTLPAGYIAPTWDFQEFEEEDFMASAQSVSTLVEKGILTANEARETLNFPAIEETQLTPTGDENGNTTPQ